MTQIIIEFQVFRLAIKMKPFWAYFTPVGYTALRLPPKINIMKLIIINNGYCYYIDRGKQEFVPLLPAIIVNNLVIVSRSILNHCLYKSVGISRTESRQVYRSVG